jgi:hypothetical protein
MKGILRTIIILAVVAGIGIAGYSLFFKKDTGSSSGLVTTAGQTRDDQAAGDVGKEFLSLLLGARSLKLDDSIFQSKAFLALQDFNRPIPADDNPGRPNPFAPVGADSAAVSTQVSTSIPSSVTATGSTLNGSMTLGGPNVTRWFEYGTTDALGTKTTPKTQTTPGAFAEAVTGLLPNTTYYVKAVASIGGQTVAGNLITWKTAAAR